MQFAFGPRPNPLGADIGFEQNCSIRTSAPWGLRGAGCKLSCLFGPLIFYLSVPLHYQEADIRTERLQKKTVSAPEGLGRGPSATSSTSSAP